MTGVQTCALPIFPLYSFDRNYFNILGDSAEVLSSVNIDVDDLENIRELEEEALKEGVIFFGDRKEGTAGEKLAVSGALNFFKEIGAVSGRQYTLEELTDLGFVTEKYVPFLKFLLKVLGENGFVTGGPEEGKYVFADMTGAADFEDVYRRAVREAPDFAVYFELFRKCALSYREVFCGKRIANEILYPDGRFDYLTEVSEKTPELKNVNAYVKVLSEAVSDLVRKSGERVRILEIGAGTAELTLPLIEKVKNLDFEYYFTDIGPSFVNQAKALFDESTRKKLVFSVFDVEKEPEDNGVPENYFDLVIGLDVVQATGSLTGSLSNIRKCLRPAGYAMMIQSLRVPDISQMIFGYAPGWWNYDRDPMRSGKSIAADPGQWKEAYTAASFEDFTVITGGRDGKRNDCGVLIGKAPCCGLCDKNV